MPLNDKAIRALKPTEKPHRKSDARGLYIEVSPAGSKLWRMKYRFLGKEKRLALGVYPDVSLAAARERVDDARRVLARGEDPAAEARAAKDARSGKGTFEAVAREFYERQRAVLSDAHVDRILRALEKDAFPRFGAQPIQDVTSVDLLAALRLVEQRGAVESAHRLRMWCGQVFRYGVATGRATVDAAASLRGALSPVAAGHFPALTKLDDIAGLLKTIDGYKGDLVVRCALQLQPLLFSRPGELRHMRWAQIDEAAARWEFVASKTHRAHIVPLSRQALALLDLLKPLTGDGELVFPGRGDRTRPISENTVNAALRRLGVDTKTEHTRHGWRATARTVLEERLGFRPEIVELQLAHNVRDPLGRAYNRTQHLEERARMMQAWADFLDQLREGERASVVVPLRRGASR
jgi:integrase